ncbi:uncharacterized protein LOC131344999 isoform X1 [Hemibagrus wyckioides]|uniref:uncharacterized protein LOC131344999 isoform X1 n=1 Tax=Hemibagrus wyckioides TaxID=337641 RepID=UPI00266D0627|nr:uncharacterized protein LOC131344999 isoform X1 [Hemibagrus wyckioides]
MGITFSYRHQEIVENSPSIVNIQQRWPALFDISQVKEEFRRLTAVELETSFMANLDKYTDALLSLFRTKGGNAGQQICEILNVLNQTSAVEKRRDVVIRCLIVYLSENTDNLIRHYQDTHVDLDELEQHTLRIITKGGSMDDPLQNGIVLEGIEVLTGLACALLLGLIYAINLSYPKELRYTFEFFQKILLELDSGKLSPKIHSL